MFRQHVGGTSRGVKCILSVGSASARYRLIGVDAERGRDDTEGSLEHQARLSGYHSWPAHSPR